MKNHQTTIIDLAKQLNLSKSTVSRALTGHPNVSPKNRERVLELANKMDYQRNMLSVSLLTSKSNTLGIIVPEFLTAFFPEVVVGAQEIATEAGYNIIVSQSNESYETEVANTKVMLANRIDGLMVSITKETLNYDHLKVFQRKGIPIVFFNRVCEEMLVPKVTVNDYDGAFMVVEHLIKTGKKRIAHLAGPESLIISRKRLNGYKDALIKYGLPVDEDLIIPYDLTLNKVRIYVKHLLDMAHPPDAIFTINDPAGIEALKIIKERGMRIPDEIAVAGFNNDYGSELIEPGLTTISQPIRDMGRIAIKQLLNMVDKTVAEWKATTTVLHPQLIIRGSTSKQV